MDAFGRAIGFRVGLRYFAWIKTGFFDPVSGRRSRDPRDRVTIQSYTDDAILAKAETWADTVS